MSRSIGRNTFLQWIAKRGYSAKASLKPFSNEVEIHVSSKKIKLVSVHESSPLAKISFSYAAGSRYETSENLGISHILRKAVGLSTLENYPFNIQRNLQQYGLNFYASSDRESYTVTVEFHPSNLEAAFWYVNTIATKPAFKPWEIDDNRARVQLELLLTPPVAKVLDLVHTVAYRNGLGNSIFVDESRIGKIKSEDLMHFFNRHCTASRLQITTAGIPLSVMNELVTDVQINEGQGPDPIKPSYYGGEHRVLNSKEQLAYVAVAAETPGYTKKDYLPYAVLKHIYGNPSPNKYGSGHGLLNKAIAKTGILGVATGFNCSYTDSGLVGFFLAAEAHSVAEGLDAVVPAFLRPNITDKDVARAKAQLKLSLMADADGVGLVDVLSRQVGNNQLISPVQALATIDAVTLADIQKAAKKISESKLSCVSYGDIVTVPYIDSYKK